jgi:hypothetical protein
MNSFLMSRANADVTGRSDSMVEINIATAADSWTQFCHAIEKAGRRILDYGENADTLSQAEGLRYLTRLLRSGIEKFVEYSDHDAPYLGNVYNERLKWGLDNPDSLYAMCNLRGGATYEISGTIGSVDYFNFTTAAMSTNAQYRIIDVLEGKDVVADADGHFTVQVGGEKLATNWIALPSDANSFLIRQTFADRSREEEMTFRIRRIDHDGPLAPLAMEEAIKRLAGVESFFERTGNTFVDLARQIASHENAVPRVSQEFMLSMGGDPNYAYFWGGFKIGVGEALLIHFPEVPGCDNWSLCLYNHWLESLDYTQGLININKRTALLNDDGSLTIVVAHEDPGMDNWMSPLGHFEGAIMSRWINPETVIEPITKLVPLNEMDRVLLQRRWA